MSILLSNTLAIRKTASPSLHRCTISACTLRANPSSHISVINVPVGSMVLTTEVSTLLPTELIFWCEFTVDRKCSVVVTNGICIGHPCCGSHNCRVLLKNNHDHFCLIHTDLEHVCLIVGCGLPVVPGWLTCADPLHQHIKAHHQDKGQFRFQLRDRLQHACDIHPSSHSANSRSLSQLAILDNDKEEFKINPTGHIVDTAPDTATQPAVTDKKLHAKFTWLQTHNEQLAVTPCGMILGCNTMFDAEGVANVAVCDICQTA